MYDRSKTIGASDAVHIQAGNWAELYDRKTHPGSTDYGLAAEIGKRLEGFNLELFERETGIQTTVDPDWQEDPFWWRQQINKSRFIDYEWCKFLPDGLVDSQKDDEFFDRIIPVEAKCINMMWNPINLLAKYMPQLQHAMRVMGAPYCYFSVLYLNTRFEVTKIPYDPPYDDALFEKEKLFYWFLEQATRPPEYKGKRRGWE